ncbi:MAG: hypothetical protein D6805_03920 [Planctomycetota bacterium]|nr:MAG: hypothetical protein D6805_03920 [Planctomycetota bacterium]
MSSMEYWSSVGICGVLGLVYCFYGWRFFRVLCGIYFALLGLGLGMSLSEDALVASVFGIGFGALGIYVGYRLYLFAVFFIGWMVGVQLFGIWGDWRELENGGILLLSFATLCGGIFVLVERAVIIFTTAFQGAWLLAIAERLLSLGGERFVSLYGELEKFRFWDMVYRSFVGGDFRFFGSLLLFFLVGVWVQWRYTAKLPEESVEVCVKEGDDWKDERQREAR